MIEAGPDYPLFKEPTNRNIRIWRYMDFAKFVAMLQKGGLFFPRADRLGDPLEGSMSRANRKVRDQMASTTNAPSADMLAQLSEFRKWLPRWTFICCWHMNEVESAAMWSLYGRSDKAIALQATYRGLRESLDDGVYTGEVRYIDYENDPIPEGNLFFPFTHKRTSFEHEMELRAIYQYWPTEELPTQGSRIDYSIAPPEEGVWKNVPLDRLLEAIYVNPGSPAWFAELVRDVVAKYGLSVEVRQSDLVKDPVY